MPEPVVEIPNRPAFRASEVCEIAQIPAYVLKSWEKEFPNLGTTGKPGGPRVYRRSDVEHVLKIKHLLFNEGLTLAGARRKLEGEPKIEEEPLPEMPGTEVLDKVARVKRELRSLLDLLSSPPPAKVDSQKETEAPEAERPVAPAAWPPVAAAEASADRAVESPTLPLLDGAEEHAAPSKAPRRPRRAARAEPDAG